MSLHLHLNPELAVTAWRDAHGQVSLTPPTGETLTPAWRLLRHDDAWRPLAEDAIVTGNGSASLHATWTSALGGPRAAGRPADVTFPKFWPAAFDAWPYAGDIRAHAPMRIAGELTTRPVATAFAVGIEFRLVLRDLREPAGTAAASVLALPVGMELPLAPRSRLYGTSEMYIIPRQWETRIDDPALPRAWYYLEAELFGQRREPLTAEATDQPGRPPDALHAAAPTAISSPDGRLWTAIASESDYGAATLWGSQRVRHFTTLYLRPGESAEWTFTVWRQETRYPQQVLLAATRSGGFFDTMNPLGFVPRGAPEGPVVFEVYARLHLQWEQLARLRPAWVFVNYYWDHISGNANCYGQWRSYEGFPVREEELHATFNRIRELGARVGFYGATVEQPDSHVAVQESDIVQDALGRRWHAWEPGNWVVDCGNAGCAERLARSEAEFARHYGCDAVFIDRLDHLGVNHNPARVGDTPRLALIPSVRLGMLHLNRARVEWHRRLNPQLLIGLNNTTAWAGVRHGDFCHLEGGDDLADPALPWLYQPHGVLGLRHFGILFGEQARLKPFQVIGEVARDETFLDNLRRYTQRCLVMGALPGPYGDEWFFDPHSMFFVEGRDKTLPDEEKWAVLRRVTYHGGAEWAALHETTLPAFAAAARLATPVAWVRHQPDTGRLRFPHRFCARAGDQGGLYLGILNESDAPQALHLTIGGRRLRATLPAHAAGAWWWEPGQRRAPGHLAL